MSREALLEMMRREISNAEQQRIDLVDEVYAVPTSSYCDPDRYRLEVDRIFKPLPLALGFSCELREPGSYRAITVAGVPVIMVRDLDRSIRAFVNMCSHRGNYVVEEGAGVTKNFRCGYHAWVYGLDGELVSVFDQNNFGEIDKCSNGLTPLPVREVAGLIWVTLDPGSGVDIDDFLSGYGEMLGHLRFEDTYLGGRQDLRGPNWKVAYDGYRDFYHVPILHQNTLGTDVSHQPDYYAWGPHVRVTAPKGLEIYSNKDEKDITNDEMVPGVWTIFPNVSIAGSPETGSYMFSQMFPGETVFESSTIQNFLYFGDPEEKDEQALAEYMGFMHEVVQNEDYSTGFNVQRALATGAKEFSYFGRNEGGGQLFHKWVDALIECDDQNLTELLRNGPGLQSG